MAKGAYIKIDTEGIGSVQRDLEKINKKFAKLAQGGEVAGRKVGRGLGKMGLKDLALGAGAVKLGAMLKDVASDALDFDNQLGQMQADTGKSTADMEKMRNQILFVSGAFKANKEDVLAGIQVFQDFGGIVDEGMQTLSQLVKVHKATGTSMNELATIQSTLIQTMGMTPQDAIDGIAQLNAQSLAGQVALRKLATIIPEVLSLGKGFGFEGKRGIGQLGTLLQVAGQATGGKAEESRTLVTALLRDLTNRADKLKKKFKVNVFDKDGSMRDIDAIMKEVLIATKGEMAGKKGLTSIFTADSIKMAAQFKNAFNKTTNEIGGTFKKVMESSVDATSSSLDAAYKKRMEGIAAESQSLSGALNVLSNTMVKQASETLSFWNKEIFPQITNGVASLAEEIQNFLGIKTEADKSRERLRSGQPSKYELTEAGPAALAAQASQMVQLANRGQTAAQMTIGGQRRDVALNAESIQKAILAKAESMNIETKNLVFQLRAITREIGKQPVIVKPAAGIDRASVQASRGHR